MGVKFTQFWKISNCFVKIILYIEFIQMYLNNKISDLLIQCQQFLSSHS